MTDKKKDHKKPFDVKNCETCNDNNCKATMIMDNLAKNIQLATMLKEEHLHNIFLTLFVVLQNISVSEKYLYEIEKLCSEIYPKLPEINILESTNKTTIQ